MLAVQGIGWGEPREVGHEFLRWERDVQEVLPPREVGYAEGKISVMQLGELTVKGRRGMSVVRLGLQVVECENRGVVGLSWWKPGKCEGKEGV